MIKPIEDYKFPEELKDMDIGELELLAIQIRDFLINNVSKTGGHLASNLGICEIAIALHKHFDSPRDKIVWDVGHQSYVHKILTGRASQFSSLRKLDGLSGFPKSKESPHDHFDTGHSSSAISLVHGMAVARDLKEENYNTVAVIGDGSMSGGLAYEALNNMGDMKSKSIVILNDNSMSIGKSRGGLENHLSKLRVSKGYQNLKRRVKKTSKKVPLGGDKIVKGMTKIRDSLKYIMVDGILFEELGFTYLGPVDGHNISSLLEHLELAQAIDEPVIIHCLTEKGKGYELAMNDPSKFHGIGPFDVLSGETKIKDDSISCSLAFCDSLIRAAEKDKDIVAISAAMIDGTGLSSFAHRFPNRIFDVGIAEGHAVSFASGLAKAGLKPVVVIYSTFLQRAFDQMLVDVCLMDLPVIFAIDRAGIAGRDGETHHGIFDLSYLNEMPNMHIFAPSNKSELDKMLDYALELGKPCAIRYPRGAINLDDSWTSDIKSGSFVVEEGSDCEIWSVGTMYQTAKIACEKLREKGIDAGIVDTRIVKPLNEDKILDSAKRTKLIFTIEDNVDAGGFGDRVKALLSNVDVEVMSLSWPDKFIEQGSQEELYERYGFTPDAIVKRIEAFCEG